MADVSTHPHDCSLGDMANAIRALSMDAVQAANSGHPGMPMGMADVATVLFTRFLKFNPAEPHWPDRDRFVLSAGHGSMLLYSLLYLTGYEDMTLDQLRNFRQLDAATAGHPEFGHASGIETTTGPLGQGLANAVGMALGERILNARHGDDLVNHYTYVIAGDGCLMEGISHEAISLAGHLKLSKLIVLFDDNGITIDGKTELSVSDDQRKRFEASGWATDAVDGHDPEAVAAAIERAQGHDHPSLIACRTTIGYGAPTKAGTAGAHGAPLGGDEIAATREALGWPHAPFEIPERVLTAWRSAGTRHEKTYADWAVRSGSDGAGGALGEAIDAAGEARIADALATIKAGFVRDQVKLATRQSSQKALEGIVPLVPGLIGGSADLTGSNGTKVGDSRPITPEDYSGNYIHYGVREHGMAAAMNGLALHGGIVPYSGTFLVFTDYARPSIRLSALMKQRVVYVMTHDSIGLGEDGPTHQPVEHLAALRAIPNLNVYRPGDAVECAECWQLALSRDQRQTPAVLALTRQGLPTMRSQDSLEENHSARGAYVLRDTDGLRDVTLLATGSEVEIAVAAGALLAERGVKAAVVSMPCVELFRKQDEGYRDAVLGTGPRVAVEAGVVTGWHEWIGDGGAFVGMDGFGASAPYQQLYERFGITPSHVAEVAQQLLKG